MRNPISSMPFFTDKNILSVGIIETRYGGNELWRVETDDGVYAVRKAGRGESDVSVEFDIAKLAASAAVAPRMYCSDAERSVLVTEWTDGVHKKTLKIDDLIGLVEILKKFHTVEVSEALPHIELKSIVKAEEGIDEAFDICKKYPPQKALCHNDPNPQNIIWSEDGVKLIDYEYAGINDIYFDLAAVSVEFGLSEAGDRVLLEEYWGEDNYFLDKFHACKAIYGALRRQWIEGHTP